MSCAGSHGQRRGDKAERYTNRTGRCIALLPMLLWVERVLGDEVLIRMCIQAVGVMLDKGLGWLFWTG
jgi:hypothetical protein